jgi:hypothetical protein
MGQAMNGQAAGAVGWSAAGARIGASVRVAQREEADAVAALVNRAYAVETFFVDGHRTTADEGRVAGGAGRGAGARWRAR